jgi:serine/threonine-protein kinase
MAVEPAALQVFGPYLLSDPIGHGGMATVYKARRSDPHDPARDQIVVVKRMLPDLAHDPTFADMFRSEARLLALLDHPNIVRFFELGLLEGVPYLVMEYLDGRNVAQMLARLRSVGAHLPIGAAVAIAIKACDGLGWAHQFVDPDKGERHPIIHRDVSPGNVMVCCDGRVKLLDFGIAKLTREFSREVLLRGKFGYLAPEQLRCEPIDRRVDVFQAGIVLHEMLTGQRLFSGRTWLENLRELSQARVRAPSLDNPAVPPELDAVVQRALAIDPQERYASASELGDALRGCGVQPHSPAKLTRLMRGLFPESWREPSERSVELIASAAPPPLRRPLPRATPRAYAGARLLRALVALAAALALAYGTARLLRG